MIGGVSRANDYNIVVPFVLVKLVDGGAISLRLIRVTLARSIRSEGHETDIQKLLRSAK